MIILKFEICLVILFHIIYYNQFVLLDSGIIVQKHF